MQINSYKTLDTIILGLQCFDVPPWRSQFLLVMFSMVQLVQQKIQIGDRETSIIQSEN